jgi:hypothetical protein
MKKCIWCCYICGSLVGNKFHICSSRCATDRVFIVCVDQGCVDQIDKNKYAIQKVEILGTK